MTFTAVWGLCRCKDPAQVPAGVGPNSAPVSATKPFLDPLTLHGKPLREQ
jgi:hypothetical protein